MSREKEYESALIEVWKNLRELRPVDFKEPDGEAETRAERAYYAAENALHNAGRLRRDNDWTLRLADNTGEAWL